MPRPDVFRLILRKVHHCFRFQVATRDQTDNVSVVFFKFRYTTDTSVWLVVSDTVTTWPYIARSVIKPE